MRISDWSSDVCSSDLAGFVEPGETIEEAVAREVFEEAGVRVRDVQYIATQPWPFPSQLMIGCHAMALDDAITLDVTELEEARWFTRDEVVEAIATIGSDDGPFTAPPPATMAHSLQTRQASGRESGGPHGESSVVPGTKKKK